jgi:hypothetical protein
MKTRPCITVLKVNEDTKNSERCSMKKLSMKVLLFTLILPNISFGEVTIESNVQKSEVYEIGSAGGKKLIGVTPLELPRLVTGKILVEKKGYAPSYVLVSSDTKNAKLQVELKPILEVAPEFIVKFVSEKADKALDRIVQVQFLLDQRKTNLAKPIIDSLVMEYPSSSAVKILHANWLVLSEKKSEGLVLYKQVLEELGPGNDDIRKMVSELVNHLSPSRTIGSAR